MRSALFIQRAAAWALDALLLGGLVVAAGYLVSTLFGSASVGFVYVRGTERGFQLNWGFVALMLALALLYNVGFWRAFRATPGKLLLGLVVVQAGTGAPLTLGQAVGRTFAYILSLPFGLGFLWAAFDPRSQAFHDKLAGTAVLYAGDDG